MLQKIKYGFQRMFRGYSDDIKWDFENYFYKFLKPLKEFCEEQVKTDHNKNRTEIFKNTISLIDEYDEMVFMIDDVDNEKTAGDLYIKSKEVWSYIGEHINYYWD